MKELLSNKIEYYLHEEGGSRVVGFCGFSYFVLCLERNLTYHLKEDGVAVFYWLA